MGKLRNQLPRGNKLVGRLIGAFPGQQMVHGDAQGIDVRPGVGLGFAELLRGGVAPGADIGGVGAGVFLILPGDAEVYELQCAIGLEHDVGGLHVPVDDRIRPLIVEVPQNAAEVPEPLEALGLVHLSLLAEQIVQGNALHEVLHNIDSLRRLEDVYNSREHRVLEPFQDVGLRQKVKTDRLVLANFFYCPAGVEADMLGKIDSGHAAFADLGLDFVGVVKYFYHLNHSLNRPRKE